MTQASCTPDRAVRAYLYDNEVKYFKKRRAMQKHRRAIAGACAYLESTFEFELWRGDAPFGRRKTMTGREARNANRNFEDAFAEACLTQPARRLWRWRLVDYAAARDVARKAALEKVK